LRHIACSACRAMNSNTLVGLVLKNPEIHAQPPLSSPCQNDANRNKSDRPHATAKSSDIVMAPSVASFPDRSPRRPGTHCSFLIYCTGWLWPLWPLPRLKIRRLRTTRW
jgi:hypothetical protein